MGDLVASAELVKKIGRIAQLGERCPYKAEVTGSIPVPPTNSRVVQGGSKGLGRRQIIGSQTSDRHLLGIATPLIFPIIGAVVQPGLGRQIVNLEVAGSNPVGPAISTEAQFVQFQPTNLESTVEGGDALV